MCPPQRPRVPRDKNLCVVHPGNLSEKEPGAGVFLSLTGFPIPLPGSPGLAALKNTPCTNICLRICFWRKLNKWCLTLNLPWVVLLPSRLGKKTEKRVFIHSHYWGGEGQRAVPVAGGRRGWGSRDPAGWGERGRKPRDRLRA